MRQFEATIEGFSYYSQSRRLPDSGPLAKKEDESWDDYEERVWKDKMHITKDGYVELPAMAIKQAIDKAAADAGEKIKGRGNKTWGKIFTGGVMVLEDVKLNVKATDVEHKTFSCDPGGAKADDARRRVNRTFPMIPPGWKGKVKILVSNASIPADKVELYLRNAGVSVGVGRFRPSKGGNNGMFHVKSFKEIKG